MWAVELLPRSKIGYLVNCHYGQFWPDKTIDHTSEMHCSTICRLHGCWTLFCTYELLLAVYKNMKLNELPSSLHVTKPTKPTCRYDNLRWRCCSVALWAWNNPLPLIGRVRVASWLVRAAWAPIYDPPNLHGHFPSTPKMMMRAARRCSRGKSNRGRGSR